MLNRLAKDGRRWPCAMNKWTLLTIRGRRIDDDGMADDRPIALAGADEGVNFPFDSGLHIW